ncbi:M50 family metallopeptidase [Kineococcus sp. SYSU DK001]|uniref:M50 family metallopeptidase n=1 Tax=Kineococcus sp. SYSU DK001 TaxID=3383122 RepID=UPI003D7CB7B5
MTGTRNAVDRAHGVWDLLSTPLPPAPGRLVLVALLVAAAAVLVPGLWRVSRNVVTIAHEGGHALAAVATGRRLAGIRLHSDTSGVTVSAGRPRGAGMVLTAAAGYVAPSLVGLAAAWVLAAGYVTAVLWGTLALLAAVLLQIRNPWGALTVVGTGGAVFAVTWATPDAVQQGFALVLAWFLLLAGPEPVVELQRKRRRGGAPTSDADQLARLTGLPGLVWVGLFGAATGAAALAGAVLLLG